MSRARTLPIALCCLPLAAWLVGCTGAVSNPGTPTAGVRPTVDNGSEPTAVLYAATDSTPDATSAATADATDATMPAGTSENTSAAATSESTGSAAPAATAAASANGATNPTEKTPDPTAAPYGTPETDAAAAAVQSAPRAATAKPLTPEERAARAAQPALNLTFDDLKFDIAKDAKFDWSMTTDKMESLRGRKVRIRGWILPTSAFSSQVREFIFVRDNQECCFGPGAAVFDCISVVMEPGKTAQFTVLPIALEGKLDLDPFELDGVTRMLYRLDDAVTR